MIETYVMKELKDLWEILKDVCIFENSEVKPHCASGTRWIAHKPKALNNSLAECKL